MCSDSQFLCWDGSCSVECDAPPAAIKPVSYSAYVPSDESSSLPVVAEDGTTLGSIEIWPSAPATVSMEPVPDSVISDVIKDRTLYTPVVSLHIAGVPCMFSKQNCINNLSQ